MNEPKVDSPRQIGGSPTYVTASGIAAEGKTPFDQAYALARLVLDEGGGPVPFMGKKAVIKRPLITALSKLGLVDITSAAGFDQKVYLLMKIDKNLRKFIETSQAEVTVTPGFVENRVAVANQEAFDLVAQHFPKRNSRNRRKS